MVRGREKKPGQMMIHFHHIRRVCPPPPFRDFILPHDHAVTRDTDDTSSTEIAPWVLFSFCPHPSTIPSKPWIAAKSRVENDVVTTHGSIKSERHGGS